MPTNSDDIIRKLSPAQRKKVEARAAEPVAEETTIGIAQAGQPPRTGWAEAAKKIAKAGDDALVMGEFGNAADPELTW